MILSPTDRKNFKGGKSLALSWQHLLVVKCPTCPLTPSWTHFSLSDNFSARFVPKNHKSRKNLRQSFFSSCLLGVWLSACALPSSLDRNHGVDDTSLLLYGALSLSEPFTGCILFATHGNPRKDKKEQGMPLINPHLPSSLSTIFTMGFREHLM